MLYYHKAPRYLDTCYYFLGSRHRFVSCIHAVTEVPMQDCREEERPAGEEECSSECKEEGRKEEVRGKSMRRCQDVLDSISCQKYSVYCGVRISFTKRCCNTCFQRFKLRQGIWLVCIAHIKLYSNIMYIHIFLKYKPRTWQYTKHARTISEGRQNIW